MPGHNKTNTDRLNEIEKGLAAARSAASANFKPMEGRTYIPRMSPELKQMIIDAIAKKGKRAQRKSEERAQNKMQRIGKKRSDIYGQVKDLASDPSPNNLKKFKRLTKKDNRLIDRLNKLTENNE